MLTEIISYIRANTKKSMVKSIKILPSLIDFSLKNSISKEIFFYSWLKTQQTSGVFKKIKSEKKLFAEQLGLSENTIRKYLGTLKQWGFIKLDKNGYLMINSSRKMVHYHGASRRKYVRTEKMTTIKCGIKEAKDHFLVNKLKNHRVSQIYQIKKSAISNLYSKPTRDLIRSGRVCGKQAAVVLEENGMRISELEKQIGVSRNRIAQFINCNTATTGSRWVHRLFSKGLISGDKERVECLGKGSDEMLSYLRNDDPRGSYFRKHGCIYKRRVNVVQFNEKELNKVEFSREGIL